MTERKGAVPLDAKIDATVETKSEEKPPEQKNEFTEMLLKQLSFLALQARAGNIRSITMIFCDKNLVPQHGILTASPSALAPLLAGVTIAEEDIRGHARAAIGDYVRFHQEQEKKQEEAPKN